MRRIISVLMENEPGALSRVVGLFSQRGYNIETLNVAPTEDPTLSRLTLTTIGDDRKIEQITKQLNKLVDVVRLVDLSDGPHIEREMMMVKVQAEEDRREELKRLADLLERFSLRLIHAQEPMAQICLRCSAYYDEKCPVPHLQDGCPYKQVKEHGGAECGEREG